jgi:hypothetical protein
MEAAAAPAPAPAPALADSEPAAPAPMNVEPAQEAPAAAAKLEEPAEPAAAAPAPMAAASENGALAPAAAAESAHKPAEPAPPAPPAAVPAPPEPKVYGKDVLRKDPRVLEEPVSARARSAPACAVLCCAACEGRQRGKRIVHGVPCARSGPTAPSASRRSATTSTASTCRIPSGRSMRPWYAPTHPRTRAAQRSDACACAAFCAESAGHDLCVPLGPAAVDARRVEPAAADPPPRLGCTRCRAPPRSRCVP